LNECAHTFVTSISPINSPSDAVRSYPVGTRTVPLAKPASSMTFNFA